MNKQYITVSNLGNIKTAIDDEPILTTEQKTLCEEIKLKLCYSQTHFIKSSTAIKENSTVIILIIFLRTKSSVLLQKLVHRQSLF